MLTADSHPARLTANGTSTPHRLAPVRVIVDVVERGPGESALIVSTPDGCLHTVVVPGSAREASLAAEIPKRFRPLAVRVELSDRGPVCTCVATTPRGPRRLNLSLSGALALVATGVHGIVTSAATAELPPEQLADA
jgi:hypothetical protein